MGEQAFNITFVQTVQKYPCVYDHTRIDYCLRHVTEAAWADISKQVGEDVKTCKEKWKNLRTVFRRNVLKDGGASKRPYYLNEHMQFMLPLLQGPKTRRGSMLIYNLDQQSKVGDDSSVEEFEPESPMEDVYYGEEEEEDDRYGDDSSEDPMSMVETVIARESPGWRAIAESADKEKAKASAENPSTSNVKSEPEGELNTEMESRQNRTNHLKLMRIAMSSKGNIDWARGPPEELRPARSELKPTPDLRPINMESRRQSFCDNEENFEQPKKKIKPSCVEPRSEPTFSREVRKATCTCHDCPDTQFLLSLKPDLAQMTPRQKRKFKSEIFNLMGVLLEDNDNVTSNHNTNVTTSSTSRPVNNK